MNPDSQSLQSPLSFHHSQVQRHREAHTSSPPCWAACLTLLTQLGQTCIGFHQSLDHIPPKGFLLTVRSPNMSMGTKFCSTLLASVLGLSNGRCWSNLQLLAMSPGPTTVWPGALLCPGPTKSRACQPKDPFWT